MMLTCSACGNNLMVPDDAVPATFKCAVCGFRNTVEPEEDLDLGVTAESGPGGSAISQAETAPLLEDDTSPEFTARAAREDEVPTIRPPEDEVGYDVAASEQQRLGRLRGEMTGPIRAAIALMRVAAVLIAVAGVWGVIDGVMQTIDVNEQEAWTYGLPTAVFLAAGVLLVAKMLLSGSRGLGQGDPEWRSAVLVLAVVGILWAPALAWLLHHGNAEGLVRVALKGEVTLAWLATLILLILAGFVLAACYLQSPRYFSVPKPIKSTQILGQLILVGVLAALGIGLLALANTCRPAPRAGDNAVVERAERP